MKDKRITQADVADLAGVHRGTVSLVFRNHPSIPGSTRQRVLKCAKTLGYRPDPMLAALACYRSSLHPRNHQGTIAWLVGGSNSISTWKDNSYYQGAKQCADRFGYQIEKFNWIGTDISARRMMSILTARNIRGILMPPQNSVRATIDFPWEKVSAVSLDYTLGTPRLHRVAAAHASATITTIRNLVSSGYRRIGFAMSPAYAGQATHHCLAAYLVELQNAGLPHIPPLNDIVAGGHRPIFNRPNHDRLKRWIKKHQIDALLATFSQDLDYLRDIGIRVPDDIGVACPALENPNSPIAGVYNNSLQIGEIAVEFLIAMILCEEKGLPATPKQLLIEGVWNPGASTRQSEFNPLLDLNSRRAA